MIKELSEKQQKAKHSNFAKLLTVALQNKNIEPYPIVVCRSFNEYSNRVRIKPHTVRKWLLGVSIPRTEMLLMLAEWLNLEPQELFTDKRVPNVLKNKVSFEFDFTDQEVISNYLAMTVKEKITVRLLIDAIAKKHI
jgi:transcriptional regulator with XRE-family HTH domain